ncbi:hypothetical protein U9M48_031145, partial [Paspalum notatum var. saurae]
PDKYLAANSATFLSELPPCCIASFAFSIHFAEFCLYSVFLSPSITSRMHLSTSTLLSKPFSSNCIRTPIPHALSTYFALVGWSADSGIATMGTPVTIASVVEFHPQCLIPVALCAKTSSWGHQGTTSPFSSHLSSVSWDNLCTSVDLKTQMNGLPELHSPVPSSSSCPASMV